jgi:16S rRNA (guanine527-N7)-methyltransferase
VRDDVTPITFEVEAVLAQFDASVWLEPYWSQLSLENAKINLVSRETKVDDFRRMVAEALFPFTQLDRRFDSYLDVGSGGGIPAIPILLSGRSAGPTTLYERTKKKALALGRIMAALELTKITVVPESFGVKPAKGKFSLVTMSYVALSPELLVAIRNVLAPGGKFVYYSKPEFKARLVGVNVWSYSQRSAAVHKHFAIFSR